MILVVGATGLLGSEICGLLVTRGKRTRALARAASAPMQQSFSGLMLAYAEGKAINMQKTVKALPVRLTSVEDYARRVCPVA